MTTNVFARLTDCELREAWKHEAWEFTPWLSENMDYLSEAVEIELNSEATEVAVGPYSADIVATEVGTGDPVLIENQLTKSDHIHLGQILTYLAGLEAKRIVWIAKEFGEEHRSAIRWLNDNTANDFAFFAVRLRVVRIGNSPLAPVFEVVEKPNTWERNLGRRTNKSEAEAERTRLREEFWNLYQEQHPGAINPNRTSNVFIEIAPECPIILSLYLGSKGSSGSGMYLRARSGGEGDRAAEILKKYTEKLDEVLGPSPPSSSGHYYHAGNEIKLQEREQWNELIEWMEDRRRLYCETIKAVLEKETGGPQ